MATGRRHGNRETCSDRSTRECVPLTGTRAPADFIRARSLRAAHQTPYTWPRPTKPNNRTTLLPRGSRPHIVRGPWRVSFFCQRILEHGLVEAEIGHKLLQIAVLLLTSSSWRRRFISYGISPPYLLRQLQNVASLIPAFRQTSPPAVPSSACLRTRRSAPR
jgi:hypothetical protein